VALDPFEYLIGTPALVAEEIEERFVFGILASCA